jgi:hypothetical protein
LSGSFNIAKLRLNRWQQAAIAGLHRFSVRHRTRLIRRSLLIDEELPLIAAAVDSRGATPAQTLSRVLQELRRLGVLHHVERGVDLLLDSPISTDVEDYPDRALDIAIRRGELSIGDVPTGDVQVLARRRRGQSRVRALALANYSNRCALCDVRNQDLLIASHIVRWGDDPLLRGRLSNVFCFCRMHDALFEFGYLSVADDLAVLKKPSATSTVIGYLQSTAAHVRRPRHNPPVASYLRLHRVRNGFEPEK